MSVIRSELLGGASGQADGAYEIARSLRFNDDDTGYLERDIGSAGNRKTWTWSGWVKKCGLAAYQGLFSAGSSAADYTVLRFQNDDQLVFFMSNTTVAHVETTQVFRDVSTWYHIVLALDTTQATAANRVKIYVNGAQVTDFSVSSYPTQNTDGTINNALKHVVGTTYNSLLSLYLDGYMAEVNFVDGTALGPSDFGETDSDTGAWIPKKYSGSYGTNGFYLNFSDNSGVTATTLGKDSSGNGNNWTPNNFSVTAGAGNDSMEDTPTNNWCTMNPLIPTAGTVSNGNLKVVTPTGTGSVYGTFNLPTSGKWYWEFVGTVNGNLGFSGIAKPLEPTTYIVYYGNNGQKWINGSGSSYGATYGNNDVIGVAVNVDSNEITFYKNNTSQGAITGYTLDEGDYAPIITDGSGAGGTTCDVNFGQRAFEYTPPTGFKALNTANLPVPTVKDGTEYFNTKLYTGNGSTNPITGVGFQPDFVWLKRRSASSSHYLSDTVRGAHKILLSESTQAEYDATSNNDGVDSFDSGGFTLQNGTYVNDYNATGSTYVAWNWDAGSNSSKTFTVKVVSDSGNKYRFDDFGTSAVTLDLEEGSTYVFDQSDSSNSGHPLRFSTTSDGTHNSGSEYTTGVTTTGTPGSAGAKTTIVVAASAPTLYYYCSSHSGMGGQANTNSTAGASNFAGSIQSTVRVNAEAGFSIATYTGTGSAATVGHKLGVAPKMVIVKRRTGAAGEWWVFHSALGATKGITLNSSGTLSTLSLIWNDTEPTSSVFSVGTGSDVNASGGTFVAYCFAEVEGYSKFGSYEGNGSSDGPFIYTGFKPSFFLLKNVDRANTRWIIMDNARDPYNVAYHVLAPSSSAAEDASTTYWLADFVSNGVKLRYGLSTENEFNKTGDTYIYMAFAETPFKHANAA